MKEKEFEKKRYNVMFDKYIFYFINSKINTMKTAVEWLYEQILLTPLDIRSINKCLEKAKEMEKNNICDAWNNGYDKGARDRIEKISNPVGNAEQYYNQTYKSE